MNLGDSVVTSKISGVDAKPVRVAPAASTPRKQEQAAEKAVSNAADPGANVQLTGAARSLATIEESLKNLPAIDEKRVAAVKKRLESGEYQVNPQRIADKLLHLESDLARSNPREHSSLK